MSRFFRCRPRYYLATFVTLTDVFTVPSLFLGRVCFRLSRSQGVFTLDCIAEYGYVKPKVQSAICRILTSIDVDELRQKECLSLAVTDTDTLVASAVEYYDSSVSLYRLTPCLCHSRSGYRAYQ